MLLEGCGGETGKGWEKVFGESGTQGGECWREQGGMGEGDELGWCGGLASGEGLLWGRHVDTPQPCDGGAEASEDGVAVEFDGYMAGSENSGATGVA